MEGLSHVGVMGGGGNLLGGRFLNVRDKWMMAAMRKRQGEGTSVGTHSGYISDRGERFPGSGAAGGGAQ